MKTSNGMKKYLLFSIIFFGVLFFAKSSLAANWYVRPSGGSGSGTNWNTAWNGFGAINWSSVSCGDTIWVAGGTYAQALGLQKNCTSGSQLYIRRAKSDASECTGATGWSSGFDSTVNHVGSNGGTNIYVSSSNTAAYITVSGRTVVGGENHGWYINFTATNGGTGIEFENSSTASHLTFEYMDIQGPGYIVYPNGGRGIDATPFYSCNNNTFSHMKIWDWESGVYHGGCSSSIFEYIEMFNIFPVNWSTWHPNGMYITYSPDGILRYSKFYKESYGCGEGVFLTGGGNDGWQIYGNLFYGLNLTGHKAIELSDQTFLNLKIWNNVFDDIVTGPIYFTNVGACGSGSEFKNNLSFAGSASCGTTSNNLVTSSSGVVVNRTAKDYHIVSTIGSGYPRNAGTNLSAYFTLDRDGIAFGGDGAWDIGAYEYGSGTPPPPDTQAPTVPSNLSATAVSSSQINLSWTASTDPAVAGQVTSGVTGYRIYRLGTQIGTSASNSYSNTGLFANTTYSYTVSAYDAAGNVSAQSVSASATTQAEGTAVFNIGDRVQVTSDPSLRVRSTPGLSDATILGVQLKDSQGTVINGPVSLDSYIWWQIDYDISPDGWSIETWLAKASSIPIDTTPPAAPSGIRVS